MVCFVPRGSQCPIRDHFVILHSNFLIPTFSVYSSGTSFVVMRQFISPSLALHFDSLAGGVNYAVGGDRKEMCGRKKISSGMFSLFYKVLVSQHLLRGFAFICLYSLFYLSSPLGNNRFCLLIFCLRPII